MEGRYNHIFRKEVRSALLLLALLVSVWGEANTLERFTKERPLVVACDWELPPYEFFDDHGNPAGYTIELLTAILDKLKVPYKFQLSENPLVADSSRRQIGDIFMVASHLTSSDDCYLSSNIAYYYKIKIASRADAPVVHSFNEIEGGKLLVLRLDGRLSYPFFNEISPRVHVEYHAPMEALSGLSGGKYDYFIWGEEPLKWKIKELNLDNLSLNNINIPAVEARFGSYDKELIDAIDDQYARLDQSGDIESLRDKWFHPERHHDNASPIVLYIAAAVVLMLLILFMLNQLIRRNVKHKTLHISEQSRLMNLALDMGGYMVSEYDARTDSFKNLRGNLIDEHFTMSDAMNSLHKDDLRTFMDKAEELRKQDSSVSDILLRRNDGTSEKPHWQYLTGNCIKERDEENRSTYLVVAKDITKDMDEQQENDEMAAKFIKAFEVSLIAMSFYDADGHLLSMNEQMRKVVGVDDANLQFFYGTLLFDAPLFCDFLYPGMRETVHACQHMYYPDIHLNKYLEYRIRPILGDDGSIRYYTVAVMDITGERNLYREQLLTQRQLKVTSDEVTKFERQMNYLLSNSNMFIWRSNIKNGIIEVGRSLHKTDTTITFDEYVSSLAPEEQKYATDTLFNPLSWSRPINSVRHFLSSPMTKRESWFAVAGNPVFDSHGQSIGHFGVIRDVSQLIRSQEELRRETAQAEQSGAMKATFLANMTHEIRTPLNAIVGFSDLLRMATSPEERKEFIHIISQNCDLLLRLIDDILETSNMSDTPQSLMPEHIDFATFFDEASQTVSKRVVTPGLVFIKDNPYESFPAYIDRERLLQVITNFVTNAVKYTKEGHIKVGYREECRMVDGVSVDGIYVYCEDTGAGIPKDKQASVFERFVKLNDYVQGTGLGLSICKAIAERCGGAIGVDSEGEGKGSVFWLWIPRYLTSSNLTHQK